MRLARHNVDPQRITLGLVASCLVLGCGLVAYITVFKFQMTLVLPLLAACVGLSFYILNIPLALVLFVPFIASLGYSVRPIDFMTDPDPYGWALPTIVLTILGFSYVGIGIAAIVVMAIRLLDRMLRK